MDSFKIVVKLANGAEFNAEGQEEAVKQAYESFLQASTQLTNAHAPKIGCENRFRAEAVGSPQNQSLIDRIYRVDGEVISLRAQPKTEKPQSDTLLLLLYGYNAIKNQHDVSAVRLSQAAKQTGVQADRLDRLIAQNSDYIAVPVSTREFATE
jgi:hypothetical protein